MYSERLRDGDTSFGLTPAQYASREKARARDREKKRRHRAKVVVMAIEPTPLEVFTTASGMKAYYEAERRIVSWGLSHRVTSIRVALPFVSILRGEG